MGSLEPPESDALPGDCFLCGRTDDELWGSAHWRLILNHNQDKLGKLMFALRRHEEDVSALRDEEVFDLWQGIRTAKAAIARLFAPERWNYSFLMNQDKHVHLHAIPRYEGPRSFEGTRFEDIDEQRDVRLPAEQVRALREAIRTALQEQATG